MSHALMRGSPTPAQLYLDKIIQKLIEMTGRDEDRHNLGRILFKCLSDNTDAVCILNGTSKIRYLNIDVLMGSVQCARALSQNFKKGDVILVSAWNHFDYISLYFGALFVGVIILHLETDLTPYEIKHYFSLVNPAGVFVDEQKAEDMRQAILTAGFQTRVIIFGKTCRPEESIFNDFILGFSCDYNIFLPVETNEDDVAMLFTTSGSTGLGLPKIVPITHRGLIAQLPSECTFETKFPRPSGDLLYHLLLFNGQWLVHTATLTNGVVYGIPLIVQSVTFNAENTIDLLRAYKPVWMIVGPSDAAELVYDSKYRHGDLMSIKTFVIVGAPVTQPLYEQLKNAMTPEALIHNRYGMTESHGYITLGDKKSDILSIGRLVNIFLYRIVDIESGKILQSNKRGELQIFNKNITPKGYIGDDVATKNLYTEDGWMRTGDICYENEAGEIYFADRIKFIIVHNGYPISPLEIEQVICSVEGIKSAIVCGMDKGPGALVVARDGCSVQRESIHAVVKENLNEYKQLTGGIEFVKQLPRSPVGKVLRRKCQEILKDLLKNNQ